MPSAVCLCCGEEQPLDCPPATPFVGHPGYGSRFDGCTAGNEPLRIYVCDNCLEAHAERVELRKTETTTVEHVRPWLCSDCARPLHAGTCFHCKSKEAAS